MQRGVTCTPPGALTDARQVEERNLSKKQTVEVFAIVYTWTVSLLLYPSGGGEKLTLKLYAYNAHFGKSGHICHKKLLLRCIDCEAINMWANSLNVIDITNV